MKATLRICAAILLLALPGFAVDWKSLKPQGYVSDFAGVVDAQSKASIEEYAVRVQQATGALGEAVPDSMAGLLLDDMRPALRQGDYGSALLAAAQRLGSTIATAKNVQIAAPNIVRQPVRCTTRDSIPWSRPPSADRRELRRLLRILHDHHAIPPPSAETPG